MTSSWAAGRRAAPAIAFAFLLARHAAAQATFFQVPSGEITKPADFYVQQQNTLTDQLDVAGQVAVGLGAGFDIAANVYNLDIGRKDGKFELLVNDSDREEPFGPLLLLGAQKQFEFTETLGATAGFQLGPNVGGDSTNVATRAYALGTLVLGENTHCSAGGYVANGIFLGGKSVRGAPWGGCDVELVKDLLEIAADWDLGAHGSGGVSVGPQLRIFQAFAVAVGVRAPNPWAPDARWAGVLQFEVRDPLSG
jgi:hypothetical protein